MRLWFPVLFAVLGGCSAQQPDPAGVASTLAAGPGGGQSNTIKTAEFTATQVADMIKWSSATGAERRYYDYQGNEVTADHPEILTLDHLTQLKDIIDRKAATMGNTIKTAEFTATQVADMIKWSSATGAERRYYDYQGNEVTADHPEILTLDYLTQLQMIIDRKAKEMGPLKTAEFTKADVSRMMDGTRRGLYYDILGRQVEPGTVRTLTMIDLETLMDKLKLQAPINIADLTEADVKGMITALEQGQIFDFQGLNFEQLNSLLTKITSKARAEFTGAQLDAMIQGMRQGFFYDRQTGNQVPATSDNTFTLAELENMLQRLQGMGELSFTYDQVETMRRGMLERNEVYNYLAQPAKAGDRNLTLAQINQFWAVLNRTGIVETAEFTLSDVEKMLADWDAGIRYDYQGRITQSQTEFLTLSQLRQLEEELRPLAVPTGPVVSGPVAAENMLGVQAGGRAGGVVTDAGNVGASAGFGTVGGTSVGVGADGGAAAATVDIGTRMETGGAVGTPDVNVGAPSGDVITGGSFVLHSGGGRGTGPVTGGFTVEGSVPIGTAGTEPGTGAGAGEGVGPGTATGATGTIGIDPGAAANLIGNILAGRGGSPGPTANDVVDLNPVAIETVGTVPVVDAGASLVIGDGGGGGGAVGIDSGTGAQGGSIFIDSGTGGGAIDLGGGTGGGAIDVGGGPVGGAVGIDSGTGAEGASLIIGAGTGGGAIGVGGGTGGGAIGIDSGTGAGGASLIIGAGTGGGAIDVGGGTGGGAVGIDSGTGAEGVSLIIGAGTGGGAIGVGGGTGGGANGVGGGTGGNMGGGTGGSIAVGEGVGTSEGMGGPSGGTISIGGGGATSVGVDTSGGIGVGVGGGVFGEETAKFTDTGATVVIGDGGVAPGGIGGGASASVVIDGGAVGTGGDGATGGSSLFLGDGGAGTIGMGGEVGGGGGASLVIDGGAGAFEVGGGGGGGGGASLVIDGGAGAFEVGGGTGGGVGAIGGGMGGDAVGANLVIDRGVMVPGGSVAAVNIPSGGDIGTGSANLVIEPNAGGVFGGGAVSIGTDMGGAGGIGGSTGIGGGVDIGGAGGMGGATGIGGDAGIGGGAGMGGGAGIGGSVGIGGGAGLSGGAGIGGGAGMGGAGGSWTSGGGSFGGDINVIDSRDFFQENQRGVNVLAEAGASGTFTKEGELIGIVGEEWRKARIDPAVCRKHGCTGPTCYLPYDQDCKKFVICQRTSVGSYVAWKMRCAFGSHWGTKGTCERIEDLYNKGYRCPNDPCASGTTERYADEDESNCRTFWQCSNGISTPVCCPPGTRFDRKLVRCEPDPLETCRAPCPLKIEGCSVPGERTMPFYDGNCRTYWDCENRGHPHPVCCKDGMYYNVAKKDCDVDVQGACKDTCPNEYLTDVCGMVGNNKVTSYPLYDGMCRTYMKCNPNGYDEAFCCKQRHRYDVNEKKCVPVLDVLDICNDEVCPYKEDCRLSSVPGEPNMFIDKNINIKRMCAPGTEFDESICTCAGHKLAESCRFTVVPGQPNKFIDRDINITRECAPGTEFNRSICTCTGLPFDEICNTKETWVKFDKIHDVWSIKNHGGAGSVSPYGNLKKNVTDTGVTYGTFNGDSGLMVWPYTQTAFPAVSMRINFQPVSGGGGKQVLVSNCLSSGGRQPSFVVMLDPATGMVEFTGRTENGDVSLNVPYDRAWNQLSLVFDGNNVLLLNEDAAGTGESYKAYLPLQGDILPSEKSLRFGPCKDDVPADDGFTGFISEVTFSKCLDKATKLFLDETIATMPAEPGRFVVGSNVGAA